MSAAALGTATAPGTPEGASRLVAGLVAFLAFLAAQRIAELALSARHASRLAARGGRLEHRDGFRLIVAVHLLYPAVLAAEVVWGAARPPAIWPVWAALWIAAQAIRELSIRALGDRWTVRVWVVPGEPRVTRGLYRWWSHPNYVAVVTELVAGPMMFGAWRTAVGISLLNAVALARRIRAENAALARAASGSGVAASR